MGVRLRTTLTATAVVAAALSLAAVVLFLALDSSLAESTRRMADQDATKQAVRVMSGDASGAGDQVFHSDRLFRDDRAGLDGGVAGSGPASGSGSADAGPAKNGTIEVTKIVRTGDGLVTVVGKASTAPAREALATLRNVLVPGVPALLALVALATWLAVGRVLRPVSDIRAKVADITAYDLHERVPEPDTRDEIAALARTVNATLDRLRTAVEAHRQFVADAAHELRSPMAILRTRLELARPAEKRLAGEALDDVARLTSLTADLLLLARLDAREPVRAEEFDLAQVVAEEAGRVRPRTDVRVRLDVAPDLLVDGCADQVRRLVANLVDNAVRHATGTVRVTLAGDDAGRAVLDVTDDGPGIPAEHHADVFDRFTRLDHARGRDTGGSGLGLPIARDIAHAHAGSLRVLPSAAGAHLRALFPLVGKRSVRSVASERPERNGGAGVRPAGRGGRGERHMAANPAG